MARRGYREGQVQVTTWLDPELRDRIARKAARNGRSMQAEVVEALRGWLGEEARDGDAGVGPRVGLAAVADQRRSGPVAGRDGSGAARVGVGERGDARLTPVDLDALLSERMALWGRSDAVFAPVSDGQTGDWVDPAEGIA